MKQNERKEQNYFEVKIKRSQAKHVSELNAYFLLFTFEIENLDFLQKKEKTNEKYRYGNWHVDIIKNHTCVLIKITIFSLFCL